MGGVRERISQIFVDHNPALRDHDQHRDQVLFSLDEIEMQLPVDVGDYTDFYASKEHATNVGSLFRDPENALLPNWLHIPIGYHGRSSSIVPEWNTHLLSQWPKCPERWKWTRIWAFKITGL